MRTHRIVAIIAFVMSLLFIGVAYEKGARDGLDSRINYGITHDIWAMTVAISEGFYHSGGGYIGHLEVRDALIKELAPDGIYVYNPKTEALAKDRDAIERAIRSAISLDPEKLHSYKDYPFVVNWGEDSGQADYYQLAFLLFGYHADAMYKLYFFLFALSACLFAWQFHSKPWAMLVMCTVSMGLCAMLFLDTFYHRGMPSVNSNRFMTSLAFIAILHWLLLLSQNRNAERKLPPAQWLPAIAQAFLLSFVISVRHSAQLYSTLITMWALLPLFLQLYRAKRAGNPYWPVIARARHLLVGLVIFMFITGGYNAVRLMMHNPYYFTNCVQPQHFTWHSLYLGLSLHPDWPQYAPPEISHFTNHQDGIGFLRSEKLYKDENPGKEFVCNFGTTYYPARLHEKYMFSEYVKFAWQHPLYMLQLHGWYKPARLYETLKPRFGNVPQSWWLAMATAWVFALAAGLCLGDGWIKGLRPAARALAVMFAGSLLPSFIAYALYTSDIVWLALASLCVAGVAVAASTGAAIARRMPNPA